MVQTGMTDLDVTKTYNCGRHDAEYAEYADFAD